MHAFFFALAAFSLMADAAYCCTVSLSLKHSQNCGQEKCLCRNRGTLLTQHKPINIYLSSIHSQQSSMNAVDYPSVFSMINPPG